MFNQKKSWLLHFVWMLSLLFVFTFKIPQNHFQSIVETFEVTIDKWDVLQFLLGFYPAEIGETWTYLDLTDMKQLFLPIVFQLLGIFFTIGFLRYPLSFHVFVKKRAVSRGAYFSFFLKKVSQDAALYTLAFMSSLLILLKTSPVISLESTFKYQQGNVFLALLAYGLIFFCLLNVASLFIFIGYIKNKTTNAILFVMGSVTLVNILDRFILPNNLILFDKHFYFIDSLLFWLFLWGIEILYLSKMPFIQEEYND